MKAGKADGLSPARAGGRSHPQNVSRQIEELGGRDAGEIGDDFTNDASIGLRVMRLEIFCQMMRGVALACSVAGHDEFAAESDGLRDLFVICRLFSRALSPFTRLVLMREMMQDVVGVVGPEDMLTGVVGSVIEMEYFSPVIIHDDQEAWRGRSWISDGV